MASDGLFFDQSKTYHKKHFNTLERKEMRKLEFNKMYQIETAEDNTMNIQAAQTWITDYAGKREAEADIVIGIFDENTGDEMFTSLTTPQVDKLIQRLQHLKARVEEYNSTF